MYCREPLRGYHLTGNYMQFGYGEMLPAFLGTLILIFFFKKKCLAILAVFYFIELCLFANKGAIVTAAVLVLCVIILSKKHVDIKMYLCISLCFLFVIIFYKNILEQFYEIAKKLNFNSYSLNTIAMMLNGKSESVLNLRFDIWNDVLALMSGHWLDGYGIGYYMSIRQTYPHNLLLDILIHGGLLCLVPFCILFAKSMLAIKKISIIDKINFAVCMLLIWIIPMNMSLTLWQYAPFWIYFWIVFSSDKHYDTESEEKKGMANK